MRLADDGTLRLSPSDLANHLACPHLTQLELRVVRGELARLEAEGRRVARMLTYEDEGFDAEEARRATEDAIRAGEADVIYQAYLTDGTWRGFADFLERVDPGEGEASLAPTGTGDLRARGYEARSLREPLHLIQLRAYSARHPQLTARQVRAGVRRKSAHCPECFYSVR